MVGENILLQGEDVNLAEFAVKAAAAEQENGGSIPLTPLDCAPLDECGLEPEAIEEDDDQAPPLSTEAVADEEDQDPPTLVETVGENVEHAPPTPGYTLIIAKFFSLLNEFCLRNRCMRRRKARRCREGRAVQ